jgi:hypothetical protein
MFSSLENIVVRLFGWYFFNFRLFSKCKICKKSFVKQIFPQQNSGNKGKKRSKTEKQSRVRIKSKNISKRNRNFYFSLRQLSVCRKQKIPTKIWDGRCEQVLCAPYILRMPSKRSKQKKVRSSKEPRTRLCYAVQRPTYSG